MQFESESISIGWRRNCIWILHHCIWEG